MTVFGDTRQPRVRKVTRRRFIGASLVALTGVASASLLSACSQGGAPAQSSSATAPAQQSVPVELNFWYFGGIEPEIAWIGKRTEDFNKSQSKIRVTQTNVAQGERRTKVVTAHQAGTIADVFGLGADMIADFSAMELIEPLSDTFPEVLKEKDRWVPVFWDMMQWQGKVWTIPHNGNGRVIYANKLKFDEAGLRGPVDEIKTWDDLLRVAKVLTKGNTAGFGVDLSKDSAFGYNQQFLHAAGGRYDKADASGLELDSVAMSETFKFYRNLFQAGVMPKGALEQNYIQHVRLYAQGMDAVIATGSWFPGVAKEQGYIAKDTDIVVPYPVSNPKYGAHAVSRNTLTMESYFLAAKSKRKQEAWEFLKYATNDESLLGWGAIFAGRLPVDKKTYEHPDTAKLQPGLVRLYKDGSLFRDALPSPLIPGQSQWQVFVGEALARAVQVKTEGEIKPILDDLQRRSEAIYKELK